MFDTSQRDLIMETRFLWERPTLSLEDALTETESLFTCITTRLQSLLVRVFRTELEFQVRQCMTEEKVFSTTRTKEEAAALARGCWGCLDRDKLLNNWNRSLPQIIPEYLSWWCMRVTVWSWTRTKNFKDQVVDEVADQIILNRHQETKSLIGSSETQTA